MGKTAEKEEQPKRDNELRELSKITDQISKDWKKIDEQWPPQRVKIKRRL